MKNTKLLNVFFILLTCFFFLSHQSYAARKKISRSGAPELGPYIRSENDPQWYPGDSQSPGRWIGGITGNNTDTLILGSEEAAEAYYPWGYTARYHRRGKLCVANQFATNELGELVLYEKIRPLIYCNY